MDNTKVTPTPTPTPTPVSEEDFLDQDPDIRGQTYACISFVSPEDVIQRKDVFEFSKFVEAISKDIDGMLAKLEEKYEGKDEGFVHDMVAGIRERHAYLASGEEMRKELNSFASANAEAIEKDFGEAEGFKTSIRGFKIRGVYETLPEAKARAQKVRAFDAKFHVFVAQVGCWCPWSPDPAEIADSEYAETHLNTLMKNYKANEAVKDEFYEKRKDYLVANALEKQKKMATIAIIGESDIPKGDLDPWLSKIESEQNIIAQLEI